jgi:hypothetical protein
MVMKRFHLDEVLAALEAVHQEKGFVTYELVGAKVGLSRQAVQIGLRRHVDRGAVPASIYDKYWPPQGDKKEVTFHLNPETVDFIKTIASQLRVKPNTIVESALAHYRQHLKATTQIE